ncbi:MAG: ABC transporter permease [Gemmatimonadota bacterium]
MKLWSTFRFELAYQLRRGSTWLYLPALALIAFAQVVGGYLPDARYGGFLLTAPYVVAYVTAVCSLIWLLVAAYVAGDAAARDVETGMFPLNYASPVRKAEYLGGRFLAAFVLNALILLAVPAGIWLGMHAPEVEAEIRGPFWPEAYLSAYAFLALPSAFVGTAIQFAFAALGRRAIASYVGGVLLLVVTFAGAVGLPLLLDWDVARWFDPIGVMGLLPDSPTSGWTTLELNSRLTWLDGSLLLNRLLWIGIGLATLVVTHTRFRFEHPTPNRWWSRLSRPGQTVAPTPVGSGSLGSAAISVPEVGRTFDFRTRARQTLAVAVEAFGKTVTTWISLLLLGVVALFALASVDNQGDMGIPMVRSTDLVLFSLQNPGAPPAYLIIPVLIVYWAGELVWRERDAGVSEIVDAAPVPDWVLFLGKFMSLGLLIGVCMAIQITAGVLVQVTTGEFDIQIGRYLQVLFGLQLTHYLLSGLLVLVIQEVVNQKQVGHLLTVVASVLMLGGPEFGLPEFLAYGFDPGWSYTEMSDFGASLGPWMRYQLYWTAWALLFAVVARLLWVRGKEEGIGARVRAARRRFTGPTAWTGASAVFLTLTLGGFVFYHTRVLNASLTPVEAMERLAEYERRFGQFAEVPQPRLTGTSLEVELYPERREVEIRGTHRLVNDDLVPIDSVHLEPRSDVETFGIEFDRSARLVLDDEELDHRIYALEEPLQPGDSLDLRFEVRFRPRVFPTGSVDASVVANGTVLNSQEWLPAIGYQRGRELGNVAQRQAHGLPPRPAIPSLYDLDAREVRSWAGERIAIDVVVGTAEDQTAIAPGLLREAWTEEGRRYFRYSTDAPIGNEYIIASADYALHEGEWNAVAIQIFHDPRHVEHLDRIVQSVRASLDHYTEQFGPYPYSYIRFVEQRGPGFGLHAEASTITYREWFNLMNPETDPELPDVPFAVVAHEVGHQWWGAQLGYAFVEGAGVLSESLAWYSAIGVVEEALGREEMRRLLRWMREPYPVEPQNVPLLQAANDYLLYRKGPFAMFALREYVGADAVNGALRRLLEVHAQEGAPLPTTLDLYRELQAVTPDSLKSLLHDLFEANTTWEFEAERATAEPTDERTWRVTLDVRARKVVMDNAGAAAEMPMDDWVQVGVFAAPEESGDPGQKDEELGEPLYLELHRISSTEPTITVTVRSEPGWAGIDPYHLLDWEEDENVAEVATES